MSTAAKSPEQVEHASGRKLAPLLEIIVAYGFIEGALWTSSAMGRYLWSWAALLWIVGVTVYRRPSLAELGLTRRGLRNSLWFAGLGVFFAATALLIGYGAGTLHDYSRKGDLALRATGYLIWAFEQEFILQSFFLRRLETLVGRESRPVLIAALLFAAAHIPSPVLTAGAFLMGYLFCSVFRRYRNLYPLALAHWLIGLSLSLTLPDWISHHMKVGIGYLHFVAH